MVLNYIWIAFWAIAFVVALIKLIFLGDMEVFPTMMNGSFEAAKNAFEISLGLTGVLSLWLGVMKIGEKGGIVNALSKVLSPVFCKLFPDIPKGHPATGSIFMNISANLLGLDNAATPLGLKAMEQLQELNKDKQTASNAMIMFLVLNTSGLTLIPVSIMVYRAQMGANMPTDVFVPILIATFFSTLTGIIVTSIYQKINLLNKTLLFTLGGLLLLVCGMIWGLMQLDKDTMNVVSSNVANVLLMGIIMLFIGAGVYRCKRGFFYCYTHYTLFNSHSYWSVGVSFFGRNGYAHCWRKTSVYALWNNNELCRCTPYGFNEAFVGKWSARYDGRCDEDLWCRLFRWTIELHISRVNRYHLLYSCRLFW